MSQLFFRNEVIIYEILKLLKDSDIYENSLYSCLYINRYWCRLTVPFLWKIPFLKETKSNIVIETYISCLSEDFSNCLSDDERSMLQSLINLTPLFEYEIYLKEISFKSLNKAVRNWFDSTFGDDYRKDNFTKKLELCLFKMFAEKSIYLESIAIELEVDSCWNIFECERTKISNIRNLSLSFPSIKDNENQFLTDVKKFLGQLGMIENLDEVCFFVDENEFSDNNELIIKSSKEIMFFVQSQKNLKGFNLIGGEDNHLDAKEIISSALKHHSQSLMYLNIDNVNFNGMSFNYFEKCPNLESLGMGFCKGLQNIDPNIKFKSLKKLELSLNDFQNNFTASILKKAGENLVELDIDDIPEEITDVLVRHCSKIENLSISGKNELKSILPLLSELKNLKRLEFMQVIETEIQTIDENLPGNIEENLPGNIMIMKIISKLFTPDANEFDRFYESTQHLDFSLMSIIFPPEVKSFKSFKYEYSQSSLEINVSSTSEGPYPSDEVGYRNITLKKKRSDILLKLNDLNKKLREDNVESC